jgi:hypothetical protein
MKELLYRPNSFWRDCKFWLLFLYCQVCNLVYGQSDQLTAQEGGHNTCSSSDHQLQHNTRPVLGLRFKDLPNVFNFQTECQFSGSMFLSVTGTTIPKRGGQFRSPTFSPPFSAPFALVFLAEIFKMSRIVWVWILNFCKEIRDRQIFLAFDAQMHGFLLHISIYK